jgi:L-threonylcarbamoyladenylate synthase
MTISKAIEILKHGGIIIFPTDTAYGIGCRIDNEQAVRRLFTIRKRPLTQAIPVLVDSMEMALEYFLSPNIIVRRLMEDYWPGAVTIVSHCLKRKVSPIVLGGGNTIGLRMPNHEMILHIIRSVGVPLAGPSANLHGDNTPYTYMDVSRELINHTDGIITGICQIKKCSTVVDCTYTPPHIIRKGAVDISIKKYV